MHHKSRGRRVVKWITEAYFTVMSLACWYPLEACLSRVSDQQGAEPQPVVVIRLRVLSVHCKTSREVVGADE